MFLHCPDLVSCISLAPGSLLLPCRMSKTRKALEKLQATSKKNLQPVYEASDASPRGGRRTQDSGTSLKVGPGMQIRIACCSRALLSPGAARSPCKQGLWSLLSWHFAMLQLFVATESGDPVRRVEVTTLPSVFLGRGSS